MKIVHLLVICGFLLIAGGCDESSPDGLPVAKMKIGSRPYQIEVARTDAQQEKGLMQRDSMPEDHGMIFIFAKEHVLSFWMKNTRFPLDILFLDSRGKVVSIHHMKAFDLDETSSDFPALYAIELNVGQAAKCGIRVGDVVQIPAEALASGS